MSNRGILGESLRLAYVVYEPAGCNWIEGRVMYYVTRR